MHRAITLLVPLFFSSGLSAGEFATHRDDHWHQWRGPRGDGVAMRGDPPVEWDEQTNVTWKVELPGEGSATPIVWQDRLFLLAAIKTDRVAEQPPAADPTSKTEPPQNYYQFVVLCQDRATGRERWRQVACEAVPHEGRHGTNTYASASPTTDGRRLYASFGSRGIYCYDLDGNFIWRRDLGRMRTRYGWGEATSPVVYGDSLVVNWDHEDQSFITVLDAQNGETRWKADRDEPTSWATPLVVEHNGRVQVIANGTNRVRSYDLATGDVIWQCGGQTVNAIPSPLATGEVVICMSGYRGAAAYAIGLDSVGDVTDTEKVLWSYHQGTPYVPSPIVYGNHLYFTAANTSVLSCLDIASGKPVFERQRLPGLSNVYASPAAAAGRVYFVGRDGATVVIRHGTELEVLATNRLDEAIDASPVIAGKQLFLRGSRHCYCLEDHATSSADTAPVERAIAYLAREVPQWSAKNGCFSCHNNGDAARALYTAARLGFRVGQEALADTTGWLTQPDRWEHNGGEGIFSDKKLAAIQFAAALVAARQAGAVQDPAPLDRCAELIAAFQESDGSWSVDAQSTVGSPATYGSFLATAISLRTLAEAGGRFSTEIDKANRWLRTKQPKTVLDAAATLLGLGTSADAEATALRSLCLSLIRQGQRESGGWGPFVTSPAEPFDTAVVLLALSQAGDHDHRAEAERSMIERGRQYLLACQDDDGSWAETTRPAGGESYAQRISTTAWATLALLATPASHMAEE